MADETVGEQIPSLSFRDQVFMSILPLSRVWDKRANAMLSRLTFQFLYLFLSGICIANAGPLQDAAREGDVEQIKQLLAQGADINQSTGTATALYYAIQEDHSDAAVLLIDRGADVNAPSIWGTPLHAGAAEGLTEVVRLLLEHGADPNARTNLQTPLHLAAKNGHIEVVRLLLDYGAD